jgi:hypothetical protein
MRNPMKTVYKLTFAFLLVSQVAASQTRHFGNYFNKWRYWGPMFTLKEDSTFDYVIRTNAGTVTTTKPGEYGTITTTTDSYIFLIQAMGHLRCTRTQYFLAI